MALHLVIVSGSARRASIHVEAELGAKLLNTVRTWVRHRIVKLQD